MSEEASQLEAERIDPELPRQATKPGLVNVSAAFVGGLLGTLARYLVDLGWPEHDGSLPHTTILINCVGSFLIGVLATRLDRREVPRHHLRAFLVTGVLGGWTTMSALAVASVRYGEAGPSWHDAVVMAGALILGIGATVLGRIVARPRATGTDG